ncbi:MAG: PD-(D/E)XK nuclease family protein, partial [Bacteroidia bacterium]
EVVDVEFLLDGLKIAENDKCQVIYKGFIDLVLRHKIDGTYLILDWKTSKKKWDIAKKLKDSENFFAQLCLYKHFYSQVKEIPFENIETKFYNLPREEPKLQSPYNGNLKREYVNSFIEHFIETCYKIYDHKQLAKDFTKIKMVSKQNFCFRCKFNTEEMCDNINEFQQVNIIKPIVNI